MTLGEKIAKQRKAQNYTQEQLAEILGVSRQSVSKWESDIAYPETEKLTRMGKLFECSMDYLLNDEITVESGTKDAQSVSLMDVLHSITKNACAERKSSKMLCGMPLYHIGRNARGFFAIGLKATGVFAIGLMAKGIVSLGFLSFGILSFGLLSIGLASAGTMALGLLAAGAISMGIISFGALSIGCFSFGAGAFGRYLAVGDYARAMIAVGKTNASGSVYSHIGELSTADMQWIDVWLTLNVPGFLSWARDIFILFFC